MRSSEVLQSYLCTADFKRSAPFLPLVCPLKCKRPQERDAPGVLFMYQIPSSFFQVFGPQIPSTVTPAAF